MSSKKFSFKKVGPFRVTNNVDRNIVVLSQNLLKKNIEECTEFYRTLNANVTKKDQKIKEKLKKFVLEDVSHKADLPAEFILPNSWSKERIELFKLIVKDDVAYEKLRQLGTLQEFWTTHTNKIINVYDSVIIKNSILIVFFALSPS